MTTSPSMRGGRRRPRPPRRHGTSLAPSRTPRIAALVVLALVLATGTFASSVYAEFANRLGERSSDISDLLGTARPTPSGAVTRDPTDSWEGQALNILVLGSDDRSEDNAEFGSAEGMRSDTAMIVHIAADRSRVEVVSIPRDLIVEIPSCPLPGGGTSYRYPLGTNEFNGTRFNSAFSIGSQGHDVQHGAACAILTVENMTDIYIDDWAVVNMTGFRTMVDAIGGVEMCIEEDIDNRWAKLQLSAGCQTLDGDQALGFARARKGIGDGSDIGRIGRQQELMAAMAQQTLSAGVLANPSRLLPLLDSVADALHTSERIGSLNNLTGLAFSLRNLQADDITFLTPPLGYTGNVVVQTPQMQEVWQKLRDDQPLVEENPADLPGEDDETAGVNGADDADDATH